MAQARSVVIIESSNDEDPQDITLYFDRGAGTLRMAYPWGIDYTITLDSASAKHLGFALVDSAKKWEEADQE